jgi:hypothetical protein
MPAGRRKPGARASRYNIEAKCGSICGHDESVLDRREATTPWSYAARQITPIRNSCLAKQRNIKLEYHSLNLLRAHQKRLSTFSLPFFFDSLLE